MLPWAPMRQVQTSPPAQDAAWDDFVARHPAGHFLQSSAWARLRAAQGWAPWRVGVNDGPEIVAGAQVLVRRTRGGALAYVPRGPVCAPDDPAWPELAAALRARAAREAVALRLEPHWPDVPATRAWLAAQGLREAEPVQPPSTVVVDLRPPEEALLAAMKPKWRYNVRLAARSGVEVDEGGEADLRTFGVLMAETARRDGFHARPAAYYDAAWRAFGPAAHLYVARVAGLPVAAIFVVHFGASATYLYGASGERERQRMPNHLLQWEAMRRARSDGRRRYDFWGVPDAIGRAATAGMDPDQVPRDADGLWGVWGFKRGFGGDVTRVVGAWDEVYAPARYWLATTLGPRLRRALARR